MSYVLSEIYIYPIKSLGGIKLEKSIVEERGLYLDRRMMLVDNTGKFMTQRTYPKMALLKTNIVDDKLAVHNTNNKSKIFIELEFIKNQKLIGSFEKINVKIWDDECIAAKVSKEADEFFSDALGIKCSLVIMPPDTKRIVDPDKKYVNEEYLVSFADAYPFLIIGEESLNDLNQRLKENLPMNRFRPNFVFTGGNPYDEDRWKSFKIGEIIFYPVKPCARCVITTINQDTAEKSDEPLKTLATYRTINNKVMFGQNLVHKGTGEIQINSELEIIEWK
ncbi:MAG: MOSC N-terminal beta barrel domain-containing protein [Melioribacteraceae bacterium]